MGRTEWVEHECDWCGTKAKATGRDALTYPKGWSQWFDTESGVSYLLCNVHTQMVRDLAARALLNGAT